MRDTTDARADAPATAAPGEPRPYATIVVVGGGCYGSYYVRQLTRAADAGALRYERILVVDRDPACRVARAARLAAEASDGEAFDARPPATAARAVEGAGGPPGFQDLRGVDVAPHHFGAIGVEVAEWGEFFRAYLNRAAESAAGSRADAIVPSPLMPHLMYEWLLTRARRRWPRRQVRTVPLRRTPSTPWQRGVPDGTHYVSFAEWMCPINCIEPALCPEIRGPRTWSMPSAVRAYVDAEAARGVPVSGPFLLRTVHRAYGVGMFDTAEVVAADAAIAALEAPERFQALIGTVSHCHGALNMMEVGAER